jgi:toxin ParE1/3/4
MARVGVTFAESAVRDLEAILAWYERERAPEVGRRLVADIVESAEALASHPDMGRVVPEFGQPHLRELIRPPFRIVYRREKRKVRVVRVWRSERLLALDAE